MARYLWQVSFTTQGACKVLSAGTEAHVKSIEAMVERVGGRVECSYFAVGGMDLYVIGEVPDPTVAASLSLRTIASGDARVLAIRLLTPAEADVGIVEDGE